MADPIRVVVTGAAGQIAYALLYNIAKGDVFGPNQRMDFALLDIPPMMTATDGVVMELQDCALPLVNNVTCTAEPDVAFKDADVAFMVGAMPRREGMERKDLLMANKTIFETQGKSVDTYAKKTIKVVVVGNPANTNALIMQRHAPSIPKENFTAMTRLDQNRAQAQIAMRVGVATDQVENCIIWGNHSSTQYPDVNQARVNFANQGPVSVVDAVKDDAWLKGDFIKTVQTRGAAIIKARKLSSAMSAAKAVCDHMKDWWNGTDGRVVSMAVISDDEHYGIPKGLMYSYPVRCSKDHTWEIVQGYNIDNFSREKMDLTAKELTEEREMALGC